MTLPFFPFERAFLIGCWLQSCLWGLFTLLFGASLYLTWTRRREDMSKAPIVIMLAMYIISTTSAYTGFVTLLNAFTSTDHSGALTAQPRAYLLGLSPHAAECRLQETTYYLNLILIDSIVVWRCFKIWKNRWVFAVVPVVSLIGTLCAVIGLLVQYFRPDANSSSITTWGSYAFGFSLATIVIAKCMTTARIWALSMKGGKLPLNHRMIIFTVAESGGLVFFEQIAEFTLRQMLTHDFQAYYILHEMGTQIMGIAHALIVAVVVSGITTSTQEPETRNMIPIHGTGGLHHPDLISRANSQRTRYSLNRELNETTSSDEEKEKIPRLELLGSFAPSPSSNSDSDSSSSSSSTPRKPASTLPSWRKPVKTHYSMDLYHGQDPYQFRVESQSSSPPATYLGSGSQDATPSHGTE